MKRLHEPAPPVPLDVAGNAMPRRSFVNLQPGAPRMRKPYEFKNAEDDNSVVELFIYDEIGESWWSDGFTAKGLIKALEELDAKQINVHINSPGGDIFEGVAIYNTLLAHPAKIVVYVDSLAASAASFIAQAGDEIIMRQASTMMIHDGWGFAMGNAQDMLDMAEVLNKLSDNIASIYAARTGQSAEEWREVMKAEAWYTAEEAVEAGLADRVEGAGQKAENRWDLSVFNFAGRGNAPSPTLVRQSALLNRLNKENPVGVKDSVEGEVPQETPEEPVEEQPVLEGADDAQLISVTEGDEDAEDAESEPPAEPTEQQVPADATKVNPQARAGGVTVLVNGVATSDPSAIQAHINTLEGFVSESRDSARKNFVQALADDGRIVASMVESLQKSVRNMTDDQYADFKAAYEAAPKLPLFGRHGNQASSTETAEQKAVSDRISVLQGIVNHHRQGGAKDEEIQKMDSYKELQTLLSMQSGQGS